MLAHGSLTESKKKELQEQLAEFDERLAALTTGKGNTGKDDVPEPSVMHVWGTLISRKFT